LKLLKDAFEQYDLQHISRIQTFQTKKSNIKPNLSLIQISPLDIAKQLCLVEQHFFQKVNIHEFYHTKWNGKWAKNPRQAPHLFILIERYNTIGYWIATTIIDTQDLTVKDRAQLITHWIQVMNELFLNNNFNSCSQVYSALNMNPVRRLQKSWSEVSKSDLETFDRIGEVMSFASNFSAYRERLKLVQEDSPCIPRVEVVLKDLTFTEEHKDITEDGKINFIKIYKLYRALQSIFSFQTLSRNYNVKFQEEEEIQQFFHHLHSLKELELDDISKKLKNNKEKPTIKNPKVDPNKNLGSPGTFKTSSTIPNPTKRQRKKSDVSKSKKKKHQLKNKKGVSLSKTFKPTSFGALMSSIDEYSDVYTEFELFLKKKSNRSLFELLSSSDSVRDK